MNDPKLWFTVGFFVLAMVGQNQLYQWRVSKLEENMKSLFEWKDRLVIDYEKHKARCPASRYAEEDE